MPHYVAATFHPDCIARAEAALKASLIKQGRAMYFTPDESTGLVCIASKEYVLSGQRHYWFSFHPYQKEYLQQFTKSYVCLGCGSAKTVLLVPTSKWFPWLESMNVTQLPDRFYWHVRINLSSSYLVLVRKKGAKRLLLSDFLLR
jgi:hypothetical protein